MAMAHLGLARIAKALNDMATYQAELEAARKLEPNNPEIQSEISAGRKK
jgi:hypothetical protein